MKEYEIVRCPHCGGKGIVKGRKHIRVECAECGASGPCKPFRSQAIAEWNRRASAPGVIAGEGEHCRLNGNFRIE